MNRKGEAADMLEWFPRLIMMLVAVIVIVMLVRTFVLGDIDIGNIHRGSYAYRLLYDDDLLAYRDPATQRSYLGTIDLANFNTTYLEKGYPPTGKIASELSLKGSCIDETVDGVPNIKIARHDSTTYETLLGFARFGTLGPGGASMEEHVLPVTIVNGEERCEGLLKMIIVRANS